MTHQYIIWPKTIDVAFRKDYLQETGEYIQNNPLESEDGLSYMVGSSRATQIQLDSLKTTHTDLATNADSKPAGWVLKVEAQ